MCLVMRNPVQPGAESRRVIELADVLIRLQKSFLAQVHSVFRTAGETKKIIEDTLLPPRYEKVERLDIAAAYA